MQPQRATLDSDEMRARLRPLAPASGSYVRRPLVRPSQVLFQDVRQVVTPPVRPQLVTPPPTQFYAEPTPVIPKVPPPQPVERVVADQPSIARQPEPSKVLVRKTFTVPPQPEKPQRFKLSALTMPTLSRANLLTSMAVFIFLLGVGVSIAGWHTNNLAQAQIASVNKKAQGGGTNDGSTPPATTPVTLNDVQGYRVKPDLAKTISIPKLGVLARVLQVGTTKTGALSTPANVFDTAWYNGSAKPGQPGATLIDGHVSSWTTDGVFYDIKKLVPGDTIIIEKGNASKLTYTVVKTVAYPVDNVDMSALMQPVTVGKSGLNLITCGGKYDTKSGEFTQRIAVFATLQ